VALWRLLANLVGNAVRAAGPDGQVRLGVHGDPVPHIDVHDTGPGFGLGPPGEAGLGLSTSRLLAGRCGAVLAIESPPAGGTLVRVRFTRRGTQGWAR
jgi:signal transduction histidine kinase